MFYLIPIFKVKHIKYIYKSVGILLFLYNLIRHLTLMMYQFPLFPNFGFHNKFHISIQRPNRLSEWVIRFNVVCQQFSPMYDSCCQNCCNWSRLRPGFSVQANRSTMPQINMIPHPVTLNRHWINQTCFRS